MRDLVAFPVLLLSVLLQTAVISQITLLSGYADLTLVVVIAWALQDGVRSAWHWAIVASAMTAFLSGVPWVAIFAGNLIAVWLAQFLQRRVWQAPMLAMFVVAFFGAILSQIVVYLTLSLLGAPLPLRESFGLVILPSVLLSLFAAIPVFLVIRDIARWAYPSEEVE